jgi:hypothetical protein
VFFADADRAKAYNELMSDFIYIAVMILFFVLCALYVHLCDRMIGPDEMALASKDGESAADAESAALITTFAETTTGVTA